MLPRPVQGSVYNPCIVAKVVWSMEWLGPCPWRGGARRLKTPGFHQRPHPPCSIDPIAPTHPQSQPRTAAVILPSSGALGVGGWAGRGGGICCRLTLTRGTGIGTDSRFLMDMSPGARPQAQKALFFRARHACLSASTHWPLRNGLCSCLRSVHD